jgi:hypothetical protein
MVDLAIRRYRPDDAAAIADLSQRYFAPDPAWTLRMAETQLTTDALGGGRQVWVASRGAGRPRARVRDRQRDSRGTRSVQGELRGGAMIEWLWPYADLALELVLVVAFLAAIGFVVVDYLDARAPDIEVPTATARTRRP